MMTFTKFLVGLAVQGVFWPLLYLSISILDRWRLRRARAQGNHVGHFAVLVVVLGTMSVGCWILFYANHYMRQAIGH